MSIFLLACRRLFSGDLPNLEASIANFRDFFPELIEWSFATPVFFQETEILYKSLSENVNDKYGNMSPFWFSASFCSASGFSRIHEEPNTSFFFGIPRSMVAACHKEQEMFILLIVETHFSPQATQSISLFRLQSTGSYLTKT